MSDSHNVVIVGAGPVGLMLACELALAGVSPLVVERLTDPVTIPKANGMVGQVLSLLDHRGLYTRLGGPGAAPQPFPEFFFGAIALPLSKLEKNPLLGMAVPQPEIERILAERATELGVTIERGTELVSFDQDADGVKLRLKTGSKTRELLTSYVAACDGGHSPIRKQLGIAFPGISTENIVSRGAMMSTRSWAQVMECARRVLALPAESKMVYRRTERGCFATASVGSDRPMVNTLEWEEHPKDTYGEWPGAGVQMTLNEMRASLGRVLGTEVPELEPPPPGPALLRRLIGRNTRLADRYRTGRIFLAGDAAHVHAATGGPGLNLGLQDAANLGWKLAAAVRGWAPSGLLDSYERERRGAGSRVFMQTQAQSVLMAPGGDVTALRQLFEELLQRRETLQQIADLMAGSDVRYSSGNAPTHHWAGHFAPDIVLETASGTRRLAEMMRQARPLLIDGSHDSSLREIARAWNDRVDTMAWKATDTPMRAFLVRPDGYVAWASARSDDGNAAALSLQQALSTWFGPAG